MRKKRRIVRENSKFAPDESFVAISAFAERLPTFATLALSTVCQSFGLKVAGRHEKEFISPPQRKLCYVLSSCSL